MALDSSRDDNAGAALSPSTPSRQDDSMIRRREKRRHVTPNWIDFHDPYSVIALAIRFDESVGAAEDDDSLLKVPLESGPIYNQKSFSKALLNLQNQTAVPRQASASRLQQIPSDLSSDPPAPRRRQAMTPIILSGLVAAIQDHPEEEKGPSAVELVAYCRSMRRAALSRIRRRRRRRRVQRNVTPLIVLGILLGMVFWSTYFIRKTLIEYGFVGGNEEGFCQSNKACRLAATGVWEYCDPSHRLVVSGCTLHDCPVVEGQLEYPFYALHTIARIAFMPISEIDRPRPMHSKRTWPLRRQSSPPKEPVLRWLGNTNLNRLVRESIHQYHSISSPVSMLDCGCGIGGTLYSMLDELNPPSKLFRYHGIALSSPEIYQAKQYLALHELDTPEAMEKTNSEIVLDQRDYDEPLPPQSYSVIVAMESLVYSPDLSHTIKNLVSALSKGGIIIVMDDVLAPWVSEESANELRNRMGTPSLRTYDEWKSIIQSTTHSMAIQVVQDLTLELDIRDLMGGVGVEQPSTLSDIWSDWPYRIPRTLAAGQWSAAWFGRNTEKNTSLEWIPLAKNLVEKDLATTARRQAYGRADLSYYCFVALKL